MEQQKGMCGTRNGTKISCISCRPEVGFVPHSNNTQSLSFAVLSLLSSGVVNVTSCYVLIPSHFVLQRVRTAEAAGGWRDGEKDLLVVYRKCLSLFYRHNRPSFCSFLLTRHTLLLRSDGQEFSCSNGSPLLSSPSLSFLLSDCFLLPPSHNVRMLNQDSFCTRRRKSCLSNGKKGDFFFASKQIIIRLEPVSSTSRTHRTKFNAE